MRKQERKMYEKNEEKNCVGFIDLKKAYDRVDKEALWQVLKMYDVGWGVNV